MILLSQRLGVTDLLMSLYIHESFKRISYLYIKGNQKVDF